MRQIDSNRIEFALFLGALIIGAFFRLIYLDADPPWDFTWSQALYTDGARVVDGARNKLMFGAWIVDGRSPTALFYPIMTAVAYVVFLIGGVGLAQANLCGAVFGIASIALFYYSMKKIERSWAGAVAAIALATSYNHIVYSRVPMVEALEVFILILIFFLVLQGRKATLVAGFLLGIAALMVKLHTIHLLPVVVIFLLLRGRWAKPNEAQTSRPSKDILGFVLALVVAVALWFVLIYRVEPSVMGKFFKSNVLIAQKDSWNVTSLKDFLTIRVGSLMEVGSGKDGFFSRLGIVSLCCYLGILSIISRISRNEVKAWEVLALIWFVIAAVALSFLEYRPHRYFMILLPSTLLIATSFLLRLVNGSSIFSASKPRWFKIAFVAWLVWVAIHIEMDLLYRLIPWQDENVFDSPIFRHYISVWSKILVFLIAAIGLLLVLGRRIKTFTWGFGSRAGKWIFACLLILIAGQGCYWFGKYALNRKYSLINAAHSLKRVMGQNVLLVGECATTLALETDFRTLPAYGDLIRYNEKERFESYPITHFLLRGELLTNYLSDNYQDFNEKIFITRSIVVGGLESSVIRYTGWPGYQKSGYVPTDFENGMAKAMYGDNQGAIESFKSFLIDHPDSYEALAAIALCQAKSGEIETALETIDKALQLSRYEDSFLYEIKGDIFELMGKRDEALKFWQKALDLNPWSTILTNKVKEGGG